ncbi:MAG: hypothetical protein V9E94_10805 [Microthrixaceae bacterium]
MPDLVVLWIVAVAVTSVFDGVTLLVWVGVAAAVREDLHLANRDLELVSKVPNRHSVDDEESLGEDHPFGDSDHRGGDDRLVPLPIGREPLEPLLGEPKGMVNRFGGATAVHLEAKVQKAGRALRQTSPAFERMTKSLCVLEEESRFEPISTRDGEGRLAETRREARRFGDLVEPNVVYCRQGVGITSRVLRPLLEAAPRVAASLLTQLVHLSHEGSAIVARCRRSSSPTDPSNSQPNVAMSHRCRRLVINDLSARTLERRALWPAARRCA